MPTSDGIERVTGLESLSTPSGGEGGSVPQALGSKAEERAKRRKKKKDSYAKYLEGPVWKKIRAAALERDKRTCRACQGRATVVHHIRYPKNLGEEKMEWLYSLCAPCHDAIHRAAKTMTLKKATERILASPTDTSNVVYLPDDWRLSKSATKKRQRKRKRPQSSRKPKKQKKLLPPTGQKINISGSGPPLSLHASADKKKRMTLTKSNDELHEFFKANRERRERRGNA